MLHMLVSSCGTQHEAGRAGFVVGFQPFCKHLEFAVRLAIQTENTEPFFRLRLTGLFTECKLFDVSRPSTDTPLRG